MKRQTTNRTQRCAGFRVWRIGMAVAALAVATVYAGVSPVKAEECEKRVCRSGETYRDGNCHHSAGFPTYAKSHYRAVCEAGWDLDTARGVCVHHECCEKRVCRSGETYRDGNCHHSAGFPTYAKSHYRAVCEAGWDLDVGSGLCKKRGCGIVTPGVVSPQPPEVVRRPDLTIRDWWVRPDARPGAASNEVKLHQKYQVCFIVANIGSAPSGPFNVQGGGLGIPSNPTQRHAGLAVAGTREGCLDYPTTPSPGTYQLVITADVPNAVAESNEANNSRSEAITVLP